MRNSKNINFYEICIIEIILLYYNNIYNIASKNVIRFKEI